MATATKKKPSPRQIEDRRLKALGQKPWKLSDPPPGKKWHDHDNADWNWQEHMLPPGYRPLLEAEILERGDEFNNCTGYPDSKWQEVESAHLDNMIGKPIPPHRVPFRTKRPLPGVPTAAWKMPEPPAGKKWHREDFEEADLPPGYRPLMLDELPVMGDEVCHPGVKWLEQGSSALKLNAKPDQFKQRTTRPLPGTPASTPPWMPPVASGPLPVPDPPAGKEWHRKNWGQRKPFAPNEAGYRPLLNGETIQDEDEYWQSGMGPWTPVKGRTDVGHRADDSRIEFRTKRPLPGAPVVAAPVVGVAVPSNIPTPRVEAICVARWSKNSGDLLDAKNRKVFEDAAAIERELIVAMDENAYQLSRVQHFHTAAQMAQSTIKSLEAHNKTLERDLANIRKELEDFKSKTREHVLEFFVARDDDYTGSEKMGEQEEALLDAAGISERELKNAIRKSNREHESK